MTKKRKSKKKDQRIEKEYFEEIEITCPKTGKLKKQKVKVTRYKAIGERPIGNKGIVSEELEEELDLTKEEESED